MRVDLGIQKQVWPSLQESLTSSTELHIAMVLGLPCTVALCTHFNVLESLF